MGDEMNQPTGPSQPEAPPPPPPAGAGPPPPPPPPTSAPPYAEMAPPPAPPTQTYMPPPPPPTAVGVATAAPPPPPPKKSRAWIWFLVIGIVLVCCILGVVAAVVGGALFNSSTQTSNQSKALSTADLHVKKAVSIVAESQNDVSGIGSSPSAGGAAAKTAAHALSAKVAEAKPEVDAARAAIAQLPASSQVRTSYEKGLDELGLSLSSLQALSDEALGVGQFSDQIKAGLTDWRASLAMMNSAVHALNRAVRNGNKGQYAVAAKHAKTAHGYVSNSNVHFEKAAAVYPDAEMKQLVAYVRIAERRVGTLAALARYGASGNIRSYNRMVNQYNQQNKQQRALPEPKVLSDPTWLITRMTTLAETATAHADKADTFFAEARKAATTK